MRQLSAAISGTLNGAFVGDLSRSFAPSFPSLRVAINRREADINPAMASRLRLEAEGIVHIRAEHTPTST